MDKNTIAGLTAEQYYHAMILIEIAKIDGLNKAILHPNPTAPAVIALLQNEIGICKSQLNWYVECAAGGEIK